MNHFMKKIWLSVCTLSLLTCFSCSKDGEINLGQGLKEIPIFYLESPTNASFVPTVDEMKLSYDGGQLTRITGGFTFMPMVDGFRMLFTDQVYWNVAVNGNQVTLEKKSVDKSVTFSDKHELRYQGNKIVERKIFEKTNAPIIYTYEYNGDLLKEEQLYKDGQFLSRRTFYYNAVGNLDSLVVSHNTYTHKSVEIFTDYDKKPNKIKGIMVLEELLPRALSRNNYLKRTIISISESGERTFGGERTWGAQLF